MSDCRGCDYAHKSVFGGDITHRCSVCGLEFGCLGIHVKAEWPDTGESTEYAHICPGCWGRLLREGVRIRVEKNNLGCVKFNENVLGGDYAADIHADGGRSGVREVDAC